MAGEKGKLPVSMEANFLTCTFLRRDLRQFSRTGASSGNFLGNTFFYLQEKTQL
jgi:hypothetical protein